MSLHDRLQQLEANLLIPRSDFRHLASHAAAATTIIVAIDSDDRLAIGQRLLDGVETAADRVRLAEINTQIDPALLEAGIDAALFLRTEAQY